MPFIREKLFLAAIRLPFQIAGVCRDVTTSIGIACTKADRSDSVTITKVADDALYRAKAAGRNCYRLDTIDMTASAREIV